MEILAIREPTIAIIMHQRRDPAHEERVRGIDGECLAQQGLHRLCSVQDADAGWRSDDAVAAVCRIVYGTLGVVDILLYDRLTIECVMSKKEKLRRKLRNNPKGVKFSTLETLLLYFGFALVRIKGSHHLFQIEFGEQKEIIVVPVHKNLVKPQYVRDVMDLLDRIFPLEPSDDDSVETDEDDV